ncbi:MAG: hypothetical protein JWN70_1749 [Planctomycetaceae bacterium]|nr:hypothetical protein [Planctomycetaceae bacterium]
MPFQPPDHWLSHSGPAGWFTVEYPPSWNAKETDGIFSLSPSDEVGLLTIKATWGEQPTDAKLEDLLNLKQLFPRRRKVRRLPSLPIAAESLVYEGEVHPPTDGPWWRRWLAPANWRRWRIWVIRRGKICLYALYLHADESDPEVLTLVGMILQTLQIAESPADPPERFTERVVDLARREFPSMPCEPAPDFQLKVGESRINLFNFYRSYIASPEQFEAIVLPALTTVVQVQGWGKERLEPNWDQVRDRIMPMLYPVDAWKERFSNFIGSDWVAGLVILYVVDESHAYWYIRQELLDMWGRSTDELHDTAMQNLDRYFHDSPMELTGAGDPDGPQILLPSRPDAYNSSRFLSSEFRGKLQDVLGREFAVGMPNRDFFVAVSTQTPEAVEHVRQKVAEDYLQMDHPLTSTMLFVTSDGVSEYSEDEP